MKSHTKYSYSLYRGYVALKDLRFIKINSVNPLYFRLIKQMCSFTKAMEIIILQLC